MSLWRRARMSAFFFFSSFLIYPVFFLFVPPGSPTPPTTRCLRKWRGIRLPNDSTSRLIGTPICDARVAASLKRHLGGFDFALASVT